MTRGMVEVESRRPSETESFLKRVEEYDSQRRSAAKSKPQLKEKPDRLKASFPEESLERAKRLLDGESPEELGSSRPNKERSDVPSSNLAYKSAYNYEKSFSPPRKSHSLRELGLQADSSPLRNGSSNRTFVVSEEDFLLLQRLKTSREDNLAPMASEPLKRHYPSRGRPRNKEGTPPPLTARPEVRNSRYASDEEEEAPSLPARKYREKTEQPPSVMESIEIVATESPVLPPKRKGAMLEKTTKQGPPPIPPKNRGTIDDSAVRETGIRPPVDGTKSSTFVDSLEKNKLTVIPQVPKPRASRKNPPSHLDFVDSVQLKPKQNGTPLSPPPKTSPPVLEGHSFIKSALKSTGASPTSTSHSVPTKPVLPKKPAKLQSIGDKKIKDSDESGENEIKNAKLKAIEKPKPKVPIKKDTLVIPKLRPVKTPASKSGNEATVGDELTQLASPKALRKVDISDAQKREDVPPEALIRMGQLNRLSSPKSTKDQPSDPPEALAKLGGLRKLKDAPPVPKRNISLPEALKKIEKLRNAPERGKKPSPVPVFENELKEVLKTPKSDVPIKFTTRSPQSCSATTSEPSNSTVSLTHLNKTRSRGPKRKLPTKVH